MERKHRHLLNVSRSLLFQPRLPKIFSGEAILTLVFFNKQNTLIFLNGKTPYEMIYKCSPVYDKIRVFGCLCSATKLNNHDKFSERSEKCILVGYSKVKKGYKLFSLENGFFFFSRVMKVYELVFPFRNVF